MRRRRNEERKVLDASSPPCRRAIVFLPFKVVFSDYKNIDITVRWFYWVIKERVDGVKKGQKGDDEERKRPERIEGEKGFTGLHKPHERRIG